MLNKNWGRTYFLAGDNFSLIRTVSLNGIAYVGMGCNNGDWPVSDF